MARHVSAGRPAARLPRDALRRLGPGIMLTRPTRIRMRAAVVALGDLGRSARMQYHAQALAAHGVDVDLVGLRGHAAAARALRTSRGSPSTASSPTLRKVRGG